MEIIRKEVPVQAPDFYVENGSAITNVKHKGVSVPKIVTATYDVTGGDSGLIGAHGLGVFLPAKALILDAWIDVVSTFTDGASDTATIALKTEGTGDLVAALAISDASNIWDAGRHGTKVNNFALDGNSLTQIGMAAARAATLIKTTAIREITVTNATANLTAGKMNVFVEYVITD